MNNLENTGTPIFRNFPQQSFIQELHNYWFTSLLGTILVLLGSSLLFWNEGRAIRTSRALEECLRDITVLDSVDSVFEENEGSLLLVSGHLAISNSLGDDIYGLSVHVVKLKKTVEVYQWKETKHTKRRKVRNGNGQYVTKIDKRYSYHKGWYDYPIDSNRFHRHYGHDNQPSSAWPTKSKLETNTNVRIGGFMLGPNIINKINNFRPLGGEELPTPAWVWVKLYEGIYYHTDNILDPAVGDYRVQFAVAGREGEAFSIVGKQRGKGIVPHQTKSGEEILILKTGRKTAEEIFVSEHHQNRTWTWIYRLGGWFPLFLGLLCLSSLLGQFLDMFPMTRSIVTMGSTSLPFTVSVTLTLSIIGVGWSWYRPVVGLSLLLLGILPFMAPSSSVTTQS